MILRKNTELKINMGKYESATLSASVDLDTSELLGEPATAADFKELFDFLQHKIDGILEGDIQAARDASLEESDTFILHWKTTEETT